MSQNHLSDYIDKLRTKKRPVKISEKTEKRLTLVGVRSLQNLLAHYARQARQNFKSHNQRKVENHVILRDVRMTFVFKKGKGLHKIHAVFAS